MDTGIGLVSVTRLNPSGSVLKLPVSWCQVRAQLCTGLISGGPCGKNIRWLKHWGVPRAGISDPLGWHYAAWAVECQIYFLENNQLWVEAAAASSRREALSLQWRIYMCFTHVFSGLRDTCLPERSLLEGAVRSQYKYCTCSRQEIFC